MNGDARGTLCAIRIDWTRRLVESTLDEYPLFLLGCQPATPSAEKSSRRRYLEWQGRMYATPCRHVVIIGAGHVGLEFLRVSLALSRFCAPAGEEPLSFRFDVFDVASYAMDESLPQAQKYLEAQMPGITPEALRKEFNCHFHLTDVRGPEFERELQACDAEFGGITYVFIALGDDLMTAQTSMRVRKSLERMRVNRCAAGGAVAGREAYLRGAKPVVVAVVNNTDLAQSLEGVRDDGFCYAIQTVGTPESMYTYKRIFEDLGDKDKGKTEYKRRSTGASALHRKYKMFAFTRSGPGRDSVPASCAADWVSPSFGRGLVAQSLDNDEIVNAYETYVRDTAPLAEFNRENNHEWLLRMEHDRWNAHIWSEGFVRASLDEVRVFFDTCQEDAERHRLNGANLHPCLVTFDELKSIDQPIHALYDEAGIKRDVSFQLLDNDYL